MVSRKFLGRFHKLFKPVLLRTFVSLGMSPYKYKKICAHSIIHADKLGKGAINDYEEKKCRPFFYPKLGKTCQRQAEGEWFEYQYMATARYVCTDGTLSEEFEVATFAFRRH